MISKIKTLSIVIASYIIHALSYLCPRNERVWIFIGCRQDKERERFADNSKYMFLYVAEHLPEIKAIWIGSDRKLPKILSDLGFKSYYVHSPLGIYYSLRAGYTFVDAFVQLRNWKFIGRTKVIQLWHGKSMKKTAFESPYSLPAASRLISPNLFTKYEYVIAASEYTGKMISTVFHVPMEEVLVSGQPRHDSMFKRIKGSEVDGVPGLVEKVETLKKAGISKMVLYAPTFRPNNTNPLFEDLKGGLDKFQMDLKMLNELFGQNRSHLFITLHPKFSLVDYGTDEFKNITFLRPGFDIYPTLSLFDALITDYSSVYSDFLIINRPMIFLVYDLEKYKIEMGLFDEFVEMTPGPKVFTNEELAFEAEKMLKGEDGHKEHRQKVRKIFFKYPDGHSSERIANVLLNQSFS